MKFIALVSGGKDSCYSIGKCQQHGHELIALANLHPQESAVDDLDSYCFQTVGHQLLPLYPVCMNVPMYRKSFEGKSVARELQYLSAEGDEVEDLYTLLAYIKNMHPDVQGVASGAIASDYQRLRVENVCGRLGLVSLAFLWHQPQVSLLQGMVDAGLNSITVKVASLGLSQKHLGKSLAQLQPILVRLADQYGCNACGEGGEFETLTLDGPMFTHGHISLQDFSIHTIDDNSVAPVALLRPEAFSVIPRESAAECSPSATVVNVPDDWSPPPKPTPAPTSRPDSTSTITASPLNSHGNPSSGLMTLQAFGGHSKALEAMSSLKLNAEYSETEEDTAEAVSAALTQLDAGLKAAGCEWRNVLYVHLLLRHMPHFLAANGAYRAIVPQSSAPARACVATPLPPGVLCAIDALVAFAHPRSQTTPDAMPTHDRAGQGAVVSTGDGAEGSVVMHGDRKEGGEKQGAAESVRKVLHVQSHSEWAPASIGPYSQATVWHGLLHMAGQIPLDPASMAVRCFRMFAAKIERL